MVLTAQAPEFVPPSAVRISRPMSSSSSSTVSFPVDRSANIKASISPASPPPAAATTSGTAFRTCPYLSSLSASSPPFYPTNAWNGQVVVQFQGAEEAYCWIPGYPGSPEYAQLIDDTLGCIRRRLFSYGQSNHGNPLKAVAHELLQVVNDCPEAFLLKNAKSQKNIIVVGGTMEKEMHTIGSSVNTDHFNTLTAGLSMLKDKAQDLEKLLEKNFLQQREKLEALLHENRKIQVETALVLKSYKLAIACLETDVAICKHQGTSVQEATLKHKGRLNGNFSISGSDAGTSDARTCNWASALFRPNDTPPWIDTIQDRIGGPNTEYQD